MLQLHGQTGEEGLRLDGRKAGYLFVKGPSLEVRPTRTNDVTAALLLTRRGWVILDFSGSDTAVNGLRVAELKRLQHGDRITVGSATAVFREISEAVLPADAAVIQRGEICLVDRAGFEEGQTVVYCPVCEAAHHLDCWEFAGRACANCGHRIPKAEEPEPNADRGGPGV